MDTWGAHGQDHQQRAAVVAALFIVHFGEARKKEKKKDVDLGGDHHIKEKGWPLQSFRCSFRGGLSPGTAGEESPEVLDMPPFELLNPDVPSFVFPQVVLNWAASDRRCQLRFFVASLSSCQVMRQEREVLSTVRQHH